jgi:hypothetical protein
MNARRLGRAAVLALAALWLQLEGPAAAATLIEGSLRGAPLRLVAEGSRAAVTLGGRQRLVDLATAEIWPIGADGRPAGPPLQARQAAAGGAGFAMAAWGPGPMVAGHGSVYHVVSAGGQICTEVLASAWMAPFIAPAMQALALIEQLDGGGAASACERLPFAFLAGAGWPLMIGAIDRPLFETTAIRFDYQPAPAELRLPGEVAEPAAAPAEAAE